MKLKTLKLIVSVSFACIAAAAPFPIATMKANERIAVKFESRGCFHHLKKTYIISGGVKPRVKCSDPAGTVDLSRDDAIGLDLLLDFYRRRLTGGCTSQDWVEVSYFRDGREISHESFTDDTCVLSMREFIRNHPEVLLGSLTNYDLQKLDKILSFDDITGRLGRK
jgi:hypothetical protein